MAVKADTLVGRLSLAALLASLAAGSYALTVCVAPAEAKAYAPAAGGTGSPIGYLVSGCMGGLFDAGHVATDESPARVDRDDWGSGDYALSGAREGSVDFVIALYVGWTPSSIHKDTLLPASVDYRLVRVLDGKVVAEGSIPGSADSEDASSHEARTASRAGASAAEACLRKLSAIAMGGE
jgi:hypothetical protein